ncbi:MAG: hypothetical protein QM662_18670 [Gordonia sp. (in: high G+C Gram-positive bacteria)]
MTLRDRRDLRPTSRSVYRSTLIAVGVLAAVLGTGAVAGPAVAAPGPATPTPSAPRSATPPAATEELPTPGVPMLVPDGAFGYIATHSATVAMKRDGVPRTLAGLPVPPPYAPANTALAAQFDRALRAALTDPRGCVQIIIDPTPESGGLFNYGIYPIAGPYCP